MFYYSSDGKKFASKIEALHHKKATGCDIKFYYYDDIYDSLDWSYNPPHSLQELYRIQAERIRSKYDYVLILYSGGYDSTQILDTFFYNNIKIDKIVTVGSFNQDRDTSSDKNRNLEARLNGFPYIDQLGLSNISEIFDYSKLFGNLSKLSISEHGSDWIHYIGSVPSFIHWAWKDIEQHIVPHAWRDKKTAIVFGVERSVLRSDSSGNLGFEFTDVVYDKGMVSKTVYSDKIMFFWDHNFPDIMLKQLHFQREYLHRLETQLKMTRNDALQTVRKSVHHMICPSTGGMKSLIYSTPRICVYKSRKTSQVKNNLILSLSDSFMEDHKHTEIYKLYDDGVKKIRSLLSSDQINYITSKFYKLEDGKTK